MDLKDDAAASGERTGASSTAVDPTQIGGLCRFYPQEWPLIEELVVVNVREIAEMGAYVTLLECVAGRAAPPPRAPRRLPPLRPPRPFLSPRLQVRRGRGHDFAVGAVAPAHPLH